MTDTSVTVSVCFNFQLRLLYTDSKLDFIVTLATGWVALALIQRFELLQRCPMDQKAKSLGHSGL